MKIPQMQVYKIGIIRSQTNGRDLAKQVILLVDKAGDDRALVIQKSVLSKDVALYSSYNCVKMYKGYYLFRTSFSIKLDSLDIVNSMIKKATT